MTATHCLPIPSLCTEERKGAAAPLFRVRKILFDNLNAVLAYNLANLPNQAIILFGSLSNENVSTMQARL